MDSKVYNYTEMQVFDQIFYCLKINQGKTGQWYAPYLEGILLLISKGTKDKQVATK